MAKKAAPIDKHHLEKIMPSLDRNQRNATLKLNDSIRSGIGRIVEQVAKIQVCHCTALRGFFGNFNKRNKQLLTLLDA